jgi:hypothetical protein
MDNLELIKSSLQQLLLQPPADNAFLIIEQRPSGKFVQFIGSTSDPLFLDLPWQTLSEQEFYRAVGYFKRFGASGEELDQFDEQGLPVEKGFSFQMTIPSIEMAVEVAWGVFERVYLFSKTCNLAVTESWNS